MLTYSQAVVIMANPPFAGNDTPAITPMEWLAMLPGVVAQLPAEQHEEFVTQILNALDHAGIELAGCVATEFEAARWWR